MKKVSIVIPVYNEKDSLADLVKKVEEADTGHLEKEIILIDDKSGDGSDEIVKKLAKEKKHVKALFHAQNMGKGAALRTGFKNISGDIVIIQDADHEYDPAEYMKLMRPILNGKADAVFGSRFVGGDEHRVLFFWHSLANKLLTTFSNMLTDLNLTDMETCYKVMTKEVLGKVLPHLKSDRFGFEPEITARLARSQCKIFEVGISYNGRTYAEGKKIGWKDGVAALWHIFYFNVLDRK